MKINSLKLLNFRGIQELSFDFTPRMTAFVGINGVGKSTVLDAMAIALSQLTWRINGHPQKSRPIALDDIRHGADFARIEIAVELRGAEVRWAIATNRKKGPYTDPLRKSDLEGLNEAVRQLDAEQQQVEIDQQAPYDLPLAVYYDVNRAVLDIPMRVREQLRNNPYEVYQDALDHGGADFKRFFIWFRNREDYENEQRRDQPQFRDRSLEAVRTAVAAFTEFRELRIRRTPLRMTVIKRGIEFNVAQLSDGERNMLALVGDMARRLSVLNPGLQNPNEGAGVAIIDEIDLHLHPRWQREVVAKLETTFPNCQFAISTHSPQVLGELSPDSIVLLREGELVGHPQASYGLTSSQVLEEIMGVSSRTPDVKEQLESIYSALERGELDFARQLIERLRETAPSVPELAGAQALLKRKEVLGR
ncbi:AAA family ATPase [Aeromonas dhakensis]|uniref:AAA family ATPase n=1 Tax=Aeromonas dhakensis TaxID=196024 RepID=UPI003987CBD3